MCLPNGPFSKINFRVDATAMSNTQFEIITRRRRVIYSSVEIIHTKYEILFFCASGIRKRICCGVKEATQPVSRDRITTGSFA